MKFIHEGLALWYGTPDAPAPLEEVVPREGAAVVVGVHPASPANVVEVRYRVDGGVARHAPGRELRTDHAKGSQYFVVPFPTLPVGDTVEYCPILRCAGRQAPAPTVADRYPSRFSLAARLSPSSAPVSRSARAAPSGQRFSLELRFLAAVTVPVDVQFLGETPEGVRVDFFARGGTVRGPGFQATIYPGSSDHLFVRPDGIGAIRVRAALMVDDGARMEVEALGSAEFGPDGYQRALAGQLPPRCPIVLCPRILTGHPKYRALNRAQCFAAGSTRLDEGLIAYDLFTAAARSGAGEGAP